MARSFAFREDCIYIIFLIHEANVTSCITSPVLSFSTVLEYVTDPKVLWSRIDAGVDACRKRFFSGLVLCSLA